MLKLLALVLVIFSFQAKAGIYIEPYAGYVSNNYDIKLSGTYQSTSFSVDDSDTDSGAAFGGKLGYAIPLMALGIDYLKAGDLSDLGPFVEFRLPVFLKFRATYIMTSATEEEDYGFKLEGSGFKVGLAFSLFANLTANLDYITTSYDKLDGKIAGFDIDDIDVKRSAIMASIGFPFEI